MEIPKPQLRHLPEINADQIQESTSEEAKPTGIAQNDSVERVKDANHFSSDVLTGPSQGDNPSGLHELGTDFQKIADAARDKIEAQAKDQSEITDPMTQTSFQMPDDAFTGDARSNLEKRAGEMQDFLAEHGFDSPSAGGGTGASTEPGGAAGAIVDEHHGHDLGASLEDAQSAIAGGPTGPPDPFASANEKFKRISDLGNINSTDALRNELLNAGGETGDANIQFGKNMIMDPSLGVDVTPEEIAAAKKKANEPPKEPTPTPEKSTAAKAWDFVKSAAQEAYMAWAGDGIPIPLPPTPPDPDTGKNMMDGINAIRQSGQRNPTTETKKGGTVKDTTADDYVDPNVQKAKQQVEQLAKNLGLNTDLPRTPYFKGDDGDPGAVPEGVSVEDATPGLISQLGEYGMVGQPNQQGDGDGGPSTNGVGDSHLGGGATDLEDGSAWHGAQLTQDASDAIASDPKLKPDSDEQNTTATDDLAAARLAKERLDLQNLLRAQNLKNKPKA